VANSGAANSCNRLQPNVGHCCFQEWHNFSVQFTDGYHGGSISQPSPTLPMAESYLCAPGKND
jgi:hypothetical protein